MTDSYTPPAVPDSSGGISYLYDKDKKLLETVFSDGTFIDIVYDTTFTGSSRPIAINYDQGTTSFAYDSTTGNLTSVVSADSVVTGYSYDGSLTTQISTSGPAGGTIDFTYNNDFRVTSQSINGASTVGFTYDDDGLLVGAGALNMSYDSQNGLLNSSTLGNVSSSYSYNSFGEITGKTTAYNNADLYDRSFTRDSLGRITSINEIVEGDSTLYEYQYNDIGYLVEEKINGVVTAEYHYDANGNRTAYITPTDTVTATYDNQDRMLSYGDASYSYGPRGDLQRKIVGADTTFYNYDNLGNLRSVALPEGNFIEYIIDGQDRRVAKKVNGQVTKRWLYASALTPIAELDSTGTVEKRYNPGYIVKNDTTYRIIRDHLGSVRIVVNSETGEVVQRIDYDEYGNITHLQNEEEFTDIGFAGGLYDHDTGLIRFGARDYDPKTGRWTAKDPILFNGGTSNLYEYALNDPVNRVDPDGLQSIWDVRDFIAGSLSNVTFGLSDLLLDTLGDAGRYDPCSDYFSAGNLSTEAASWLFAGPAKGLANLGKRGLKNVFRYFAKNKGTKTVIKGFTEHVAAESAITRGFKTADILKIVREGKAVQATGRYGAQTRHTLGRNTVVVNSKGKVVTVYSDAPGTAKGLGKGNFIPFE